MSIDLFGAIPGVDGIAIAKHNAEAFELAMQAANKSPSDRKVLVPGGHVYYMSAVHISNHSNIQVQLEGIVRFTDIIAAWGPDVRGSGMMYFVDCNNLEIVGSGGSAPTTPGSNGTDVHRSVLDGQGLKWWRLSYLGHELRPRLLYFEYCRGVRVHRISLLNSPTYHLYAHDCADMLLHDLYVFVDSYIQRGPDGRESVMYPLNSDGLDLMARNVTVFNCNITSYDDAIVAKPCKSTGKICQCAGDLLAYNNSVYYSTGLTIGSVPPSADGNCVSGVVFRDSSLYRPFKAIYIKSNPGNEGTGLIEDITYENIRIDQSLWWTVWIGPQQQNQPNDNSSGTGCSFLYPFVPECPTQPRVTIRRITLRNVLATNTVPLFEGPGVLLCDRLNPCGEIWFSNVTNLLYPGDAEDIFDALPVPVPQVVFPTEYRSDDWTFDYITEQAYGRCWPAGSCSPNPHLLSSRSADDA